MGYSRFKYTALLFIIVILTTSIRANDAIVYQKDNIIITNYDSIIFEQKYNEVYGRKLNKHQIIKNIFLINKLIDRIENNNKTFLDQIDKNIANKISNDLTDNIIIKNFNRFLFIRNQIIQEYYNNSLSLDDINNSLKEINYKNIKLSINNCMTVEKIILVNEIKDFEKLLFKSLSNNLDKLIIKIGNNEYELCLDENFYFQFEISLLRVLEEKTAKDFNKFLYN